MLCLTRKTGEAFLLKVPGYPAIRIETLKHFRFHRVGIDAHPDILIQREENLRKDPELAKKFGIEAPSK